jgi:hypothetical protein
MNFHANLGAQWLVTKLPVCIKQVNPTQEDWEGGRTRDLVERTPNIKINDISLTARDG